METTKEFGKALKHYIQVQDELSMCIENIQTSANYTPLEFNMLEYECGMALLDAYFEPTGEDIRKRMAEDAELKYWQWFKNAKRHNDKVFWHCYAPVWDDQKRYVALDDMVRQIREEYAFELAAFANSDSVHNRLYHYILRTNITL